MKFLPVLLLLLLVACAPSDPYAQIAAGQAALQATRAAELERQKADIRQAAQATQAVLATQGAAQAQIDLLNGQAQATLTALDSQERQLRIEEQAAAATRTAQDYAIAQVREAQSAQATATAMAVAMTQARQDAQRRQWIADLWLAVKFSASVIVLGALFAAVVIGVVKMWKLADSKIEWTDRRKHVFNTRDGAVVVLADGTMMLLKDVSLYRERPQLDAPKYSRQSASDVDDVEDVDWIDSDPLPAPVRKNDPYDCACEVVELAIEHFHDGQATTIPRWSVLGISADRWSEGVNEIKRRGWATNAPGVKTTTTMSLKELLAELWASPPPPQ